MSARAYLKTLTLQQRKTRRRVCHAPCHSSATCPVTHLCHTHLCHTPVSHGSVTHVSHSITPAESLRTHVTYPSITSEQSLVLKLMSRTSVTYVCHECLSRTLVTDSWHVKRSLSALILTASVLHDVAVLEVSFNRCIEQLL
eukprot:244566-Amorphochlora_amoeboformis.AAC.1